MTSIDFNNMTRKGIFMEEINIDRKDPSTVPETAQPIRHKALRITAFLLATAMIALGCGYAGSYWENRKEEKVVIQKVDPGVSAALQESVGLSSTKVAQMISPSVVSITTEQMKTNQFWFGYQIASGAGSGVIISADGTILTCAHVISGAATITVTTSTGEEYPATVIGSYTDGDIAVIKIDAEGLQNAIVGDSDQVQLAETVYAVGNPGGTLSGSITDGIISATDRTITVSVEEDPQPSMNPFSSTINKIITLNVFQMSAAVSPGNSGGGLFNSKGELIGIVNAKSAGESQEGLGFAIPVNRALEIATDLINDGVFVDPSAKANDGVLEISVVELDEVRARLYGVEKAGVYVQSLKKNGTSDGLLEVKDRILSVDDDIVTTLNDLSKLIAQHKAGETVKITVERSGKLVTVEITLAKNAN